MTLAHEIVHALYKWMHHTDNFEGYIQDLFQNRCNDAFLMNKHPQTNAFSVFELYIMQTSLESNPWGDTKGEYNMSDFLSGPVKEPICDHREDFNYHPIILTSLLIIGIGLLSALTKIITIFESKQIKIDEIKSKLQMCNDNYKCVMIRFL